MKLFDDVAAEGHLDLLGCLAGSEMVESLSFFGGTALSLCYLGHRVSIDLDFLVTEIEEFEHIRKNVRTFLREAGWKPVEKDASLSGHTIFIPVRKDALRVKLEILYENAVLLKPPLRHPQLGCRVLSAEDLVISKMLALTERDGSDQLKDIVDLFTIDEVLGLTPVQFLSSTRRRNPSFSTDRFLLGLFNLEELVQMLPDLRLLPQANITASALASWRDRVADAVLSSKK